MSKKSLPRAMVPLPRRPIVDKMCSSCPFNADRGAPKVDVPDDEMEGFRLTAEISEFYCHETVLEDPRTKKGDDGDPDVSCGAQAHFKVCRGGWEYKLSKIRGRMA
jgi:hypothetical protein